MTYVCGVVRGSVTEGVPLGRDRQRCTAVCADYPEPSNSR